MSVDANPHVSNGTCYSKKGRLSKGSFIPCGNIAFGHWPCCHTGSICLDFDNSNACYDAETGCTDSGFNDRACPWKSPEFDDQEWVGIHHCEKGTGNNDTVWGGCKTAPNATELERLPLQSCDPYCADKLYVGGTALPAFASLPNSTGASIAWTSGFTPTLGNTPITPTAQISGSATTTTPIQTSITSAQNSSTTTSTAPISTTGADGGLSTGAKVGIGVGAAAGALLIAGAIFFALVSQQRRRKVRDSQSGPQMEQAPTSPVSPPNQPYQVSQSQQFTPSKPLLDEPTDATYGVGHKSELPAIERVVSSELPANQPQSAKPLSNLNPYRTRLSSSTLPHSACATLDSAGTDYVSSYSYTTTAHGSTSGMITPESTGMHGHLGGPHGRAQSPMGHVSESDPELR
ncbi:hypothetical protein BKA67DRAFT_539670 [Truncatella angustata]|uniref:Uncharacterized protein n=1 Tax=Truncatella angustata TaxID=152316 RepID=A0A9P8UDJ3_9PEZI|nr:uncharacterized protein BKA67DRAFT_539670 [Truncatella angustata]KAH6647829.1 hypothetical protein BKA67DRAFT_539670 [Truncatella angustata]